MLLLHPATTQQQQHQPQTLLLELGVLQLLVAAWQQGRTQPQDQPHIHHHHHHCCHHNV
jgi:hypothetical protein